MKKSRITIQMIAEVASFASIGYVLDVLCGVISDALPFVNGGSINIAMIAVVIICYRRGLGYGAVTGLIMGLLDFLDGFWSISDAWWKVFLQIGFDYLFPYALVCLAGLFTSLVKKNEKKLSVALWATLGCVVGGFAKFMSHFLSGVFFWPEFEGQEAWGRIVYSLGYNGGYMLPSIIISAALVFVLVYTVPMLIGKTNLLADNSNQVEE